MSSKSRSSQAYGSAFQAAVERLASEISRPTGHHAGTVALVIGAGTSSHAADLFPWLGGGAALVTIVGAVAKIVGRRIRAARPAVRIDFEHDATTGARVLNLNDYLPGGHPPPPIFRYRLAVRLASTCDTSYLVDGLWIDNAAGTKRVTVQLTERTIPAHKWLTVPVSAEVPDAELGFVAVARLAGYPREISSRVEYLRDDLKRQAAD